MTTAGNAQFLKGPLYAGVSLSQGRSESIGDIEGLSEGRAVTKFAEVWLLTGVGQLVMQPKIGFKRLEAYNPTHLTNSPVYSSRMGLESDYFPDDDYKMLNVVTMGVDVGFLHSLGSYFSIGMMAGYERNILLDHHPYTSSYELSTAGQRLDPLTYDTVQDFGAARLSVVGQLIVSETVVGRLLVFHQFGLRPYTADFPPNRPYVKTARLKEVGVALGLMTKLR